METKHIIDYGLASENEDKILKFLDKIYKISVDNPEEWEKEIFKFFSKELIVPYVIMTSIEEDQDFMIDHIRNIYFKKIINGGTIIWSSDQCYKDLIQIKESLKIGSKLKDFLPFFFLNNNLIRQMWIKKTDKDDTRFKNFGVSIIPITYERTNDTTGDKVWETLFLISPDKESILPEKTWHKEISEKWRIKLRRKMNGGKKTKKRDPIESRLRHEVFKRDNYTCKECGKTKDNTTLHVDHIIPVAQGGNDELDNLQTLCQACNLAKSNRKWKAGEVKNETS